VPNGVLPEEGIAKQLEYLLKSEIAGVLPWQLWLWVNDIEVDAETVLADLEEATFGGYVRATLTRSEWEGFTVAHGCCIADWGAEPIVWFVTDDTEETVFGYALVDATTEVIRFVQRFDAEDIEPLEIGGKFLLRPRYTLTSAECPEL